MLAEGVLVKRQDHRYVRLNGILVDSYHDFRQIDDQLFQLKVFM